MWNTADDTGSSGTPETFRCNRHPDDSSSVSPASGLFFSTHVILRPFLHIRKGNVCRLLYQASNAPLLRYRYWFLQHGFGNSSPRHFGLRCMLHGLLFLLSQLRQDGRHSPCLIIIPKRLSVLKNAIHFNMCVFAFLAKVLTLNCQNDLLFFIKSARFICSMPLRC